MEVGRGILDAGATEGADPGATLQPGADAQLRLNLLQVHVFGFHPFSVPEPNVEAARLVGIVFYISDNAVANRRSRSVGSGPTAWLSGAGGATR